MRAVEDSAIVKIGGSILTAPNGDLENATMAELAGALLAYGRPLAIVHGTGTVGLAVLRKHGVPSDLVPSHFMPAALDFRREVGRLHDGILELLGHVGLRCRSVTPHTVLHSNGGRLEEHGDPSVQWLVGSGEGALLLHGDALDDASGGYYFCSGDEVAGYLAAKLRPECVIFLTNVDGVYDSYPPTDGARPLQEISAGFSFRSAVAYTVGAPDMAGKIVHAVGAAHYCRRCYIANGRRQGLLGRLLSNVVVTGEIFTAVRHPDDLEAPA